MREMSQALDVLEGVERRAGAVGDKRVAEVRVRLGLARGLAPEKLRTAFDWAKKDTIAEDAVLDIEVVPTRIHCTLCDDTYVTDQAFAECPRCGSLGGEMLCGDENDEGTPMNTDAADLRG